MNPQFDLSSELIRGGALFLFSGIFLFVLAVIVLVAASMWVVFTKAGRPGWAAIIPIYNAIVLLEIVGRPLWWLVLMFIPLANIVVAVVIHIDLAKSFGQGAGFAIGLILLSVVFFPILAFGNARYLGPAASMGPQAAPMSFG